MIQYTPHPNIQILTPTKHFDDRGWFQELYNFEHYAQLFPDGIKQVSQAKSKRGVLRGLHIQPGMNKLLRVIKGSISAVGVDLDSKSDWYLRHYTYFLSAENERAMFIAGSMALGYYAFEDDTVVEYFHSQPYSPGCSYTLAWNDPSFNIFWPANNPILSEKDTKGLSRLEFARLTGM